MTEVIEHTIIQIKLGLFWLGIFGHIFSHIALCSLLATILAIILAMIDIFLVRNTWYRLHIERRYQVVN